MLIVRDPGIAPTNRSDLYEKAEFRGPVFLDLVHPFQYFYTSQADGIALSLDP